MICMILHMPFVFFRLLYAVYHWFTVVVKMDWPLWWPQWIDHSRSMAEGDVTSSYREHKLRPVSNLGSRQEPPTLLLVVDELRYPGPGHHSFNTSSRPLSLGGPIHYQYQIFYCYISNFSKPLRSPRNYRKIFFQPPCPKALRYGLRKSPIASWYGRWVNRFFWR